MRTIKFRARHTLDGSWYYGCFNPDETKNELWLGLFFQEVEQGILDIKTLGQFTGLPDKEGKEIYERDITCRHWDDATFQNGQIIFEDARFLWQEINKEKYIHPIGINTLHSEIIGNIYENPLEV